MGLLKGSISLSRYRLIGTGDTKIDVINKAMRNRQAGKLVLSASRKELNAGWVLPPLLDTDEARYGDYWDLSDCHVGNGFVLRLRIERKRVPIELMQELFRQKLADVNAQSDSPLGRNGQKILREELRDQLREQALPSISYLDAYWREDGVVTLFSGSKANKEIFEEIFTDSIAKPSRKILVPISLPLMGLSANDWEQSEQFLQKVEPLLPASQNSIELEDPVS